MSRPALPAYRLKIPCADEREFLERFAQKYVASGIFVPAKDPLAVGTRVHIKLEFKGGQVLVAGDAMVTSRTPPDKSDKPGMTMRLTALHPSSIQFGLSPSAPGAPMHATPALTPAPPPMSAALTPAPPPLGAALTPAPPPLHRPQRAGELHDLFDLDEEPDPPPPAPPTAAAAAPVSAPAPAPRAAAAEAAPLVADDAIDFAEPEPTPEPAAASPAPRRPAPTLEALDAPGPAEAGAARPGRPEGATAPSGRVATGGRRRTLAVALVAALACVAAATAIALRQRGGSGPVASRVEAELRLADARLMEGRLAAPRGDSALEHLLAAKSAAPKDARVTSRLGLLADKFEQLGELALARKNLGEARVHLEAALQADPGRDRVRGRLAAAAGEPGGGPAAR
jgi:hypothetical protein